MKITQARRYVIIGAIGDVSIIYRSSSFAYEVHFFIRSDYTGKVTATGSALKSIDGTVRTWDDLGEVYAYVRSLGWKKVITIATVD